MGLNRKKQGQLITSKVQFRPTSNSRGGCCVQSVLIPLAQIVQVNCDHGFHWSMQRFPYLTGIFSLDILNLEGESPLLMRNMQVKDRQQLVGGLLHCCRFLCTYTLYIHTLYIK